MAETQAPAQEQPTEGTTQSPALPPLPDFLQRHSVRTVKQNGEDRTFVVLNHHPLSFQNQEKKAIQELFVEFWLDRQTLQVFVVVNWMSPQHLPASRALWRGVLPERHGEHLERRASHQRRVL